MTYGDREVQRLLDEAYETGKVLLIKFKKACGDPNVYGSMDVRTAWMKIHWTGQKWVVRTYDPFKDTVEELWCPGRDSLRVENGAICTDSPDGNAVQYINGTCGMETVDPWRKEE